MAYCIQPAKDSPYGSGYTEGMGWSAYDETTRLGFQAILEHGYPNYNGGFTDAQARYATANAIRFWVAEQGCSGALDWMDLTRFSQFFRAKSGYEGLYSWCMELLNYARNGTVTRHGVVLSDPVMAEDSDYFIVTTTVSLENCSWGYTYDDEILPPDTIVTGYTGNHGDSLTFKVPLEYEGYDLDISVTGYDHRTESCLIYYGPDNSSEQRLIAYTANSGQIADDDFESITLISGAPGPTGTIRIIKTDSVTGKPLEGVWFYLYGPNSDFYSQPTDKDGILEWKVPPGSYRYKEAEPPEGYVGDTTRYRITVYLDEVTEIRVTNDPIAQTPSTIEINKKDSKTGKAIAGSEIGLYDSSYSLIGSVTTGEDGKAIFTELSTGTYYYKELKAPAGYIIDKDYHQVMVSDPGSTVKAELKNTKSVGTLEISKTDHDTGAALSGVEFTVYTSSKSFLTVGTTDANGKLSIDNIPLGSYYYRETNPPEGYVIDDNYYPFSIETNGQLVSVDVKNKMQNGAIHVTKADSDGAPLAGAEYTLESSTNGGTKWTEVSRVTTNATGQASFTTLTADMKTLYRLTETKAPPGFSLISDTVFWGTLPIAVDIDAELENSAVINGTKYCYSVYVNVTNCPVFRLPDTGSSSDLLLTAAMIICYIMALGMAVWTKVKSKEKW